MIRDAITRTERNVLRIERHESPEEKMGKSAWCTGIVLKERINKKQMLKRLREGMTTPDSPGSSSIGVSMSASCICYNQKDYCDAETAIEGGVAKIALYALLTALDS
jgi:hypothetical protein